TGALAEADELALTSVTEATARHEHSNLALGLSVRAMVALLTGDLASADTFVAGADAATRRSQYVMADLFVGPTAVLSQLARGRASEAAQLVEDWPNLPRSARAGLRSVVEAFDPTIHAWEELIF